MADFYPQKEVSDLSKKGMGASRIGGPETSPHTGLEGGPGGPGEGIGCHCQSSQKRLRSADQNTEVCTEKTQDQGLPSCPHTMQQAAAAAPRLEPLQAVRHMCFRSPASPELESRQLPCFIQLHKAGW
uniref:Uncharacterized protein n=1 Tax=Molossus molossus TaxID=27622 RepID=A0A7J8FZK4_MOLMO|nr:hypothetical protein HJG59_008166 [Molossus molossus]